MNIFKLAAASFKTKITFSYLAFKFLIFTQSSAYKCILRRLELLQVWLFISPKRISLRNQKLNILICIKQSFTKFVCSSIVCCARKITIHIYKECDFSSIIFKKKFRPLKILSNFYYCFKAPAKTNTIFKYGIKCWEDLLTINTSRIFWYGANFPI